MSSTDQKYLKLLNRVLRLTAEEVSFEGTAYRSATFEFATEADLLNGQGSKLYGGRWNPKGLAVIYASLTPSTAMEESLAQCRYYEIAIEHAMPRVFVAMSFQLRRVLDLRQGIVRLRLGVSLKRMLALDWRQENEAGSMALTQMIGSAASAAGFEALIVPSSASPKSHNILVFPDNLRRESKIRVLNSDQFPSR